MAASTALRDSNVEAVSFTASAFEITYRSRGYLLGVIPWSLPVRVHIVAEAPALEERVQIRLPWYRFFIRKFFTVQNLRNEIDTVITTAKDMNTEEDATPALFRALSEYLKREVGTVQDSILLGS